MPSHAIAVSASAARRAGVRRTSVTRANATNADAVTNTDGADRRGAGTQTSANATHQRRASGCRTMPTVNAIRSADTVASTAWGLQRLAYSMSSGQKAANRTATTAARVG